MQEKGDLGQENRHILEQTLFEQYSRLAVCDFKIVHN